jgi:predicted nucleic-acid-binding Zn-ribbon protein
LKEQDERYPKGIGKFNKELDEIGALAERLRVIFEIPKEYYYNVCKHCGSQILKNPIEKEKG